MRGSGGTSGSAPAVRWAFAVRSSLGARLARGLLAVVLIAGAAPTMAQESELGHVEFPSSANADAAPHFERGVLLLHSFHYEEAATAFRETQRADPGFALAHWGEALTYTHPVWNEQDLEAGRAALARLGPTPAARAEKAATERERGYLEAVEILYGEGDKARRDTLYSEAMARLAAKYPDDLEASLFHALSLIGLSQGERDVPTYMRAGAIALEAFRRDPGHPGAAHYAIHSFDDPVHAPLGLAAARAYAEIAPGAAHAQHMTSHIFVALGMWDETVAANEVATTIDEPLEATGEARFPCGHYGSWLHYGYLQQGRYHEAREILEECRAVVGAGNQGAASSLAWMEAAHVVDTREWSAAPRGRGESPATASEVVPSRVRAPSIFARGYAAARRGDAEMAATELDRFSTVRGEREPWPRGEVMEGLLRGLLLLERDEGATALAELEAAAALEENQPVEFGPPPTVKPPRELLGEALLKLDRPEEAVVAFRLALRRAPRRPLALLGLARAAALVGDANAATEAYTTLREVWHRADPSRPELAEADRFLGGDRARR